MSTIDDRLIIRRIIEPMLIGNKVIFEQYGPHTEAAQNPESGLAEQWKRKVIIHILPNSRRILDVLDTNRHLLRDDERKTLEIFRQHVDDLQAVHVEGSREDASRFPAEMATILQD